MKFPHGIVINKNSQDLSLYFLRQPTSFTHAENCIGPQKINVVLVYTMQA